MNNSVVDCIMYTCMVLLDIESGSIQMLALIEIYIYIYIYISIFEN